jgi:hypothetical protein
MILTIVHPYTYQVSGETLVLGENAEFGERNERVGSLIRRFLVSGRRVVWYKDVQHEGFLEDLALESDESLRILFDERVERVLTDAYGVPLNPRLNSTNGHRVFIGGVFERCFFNAVAEHVGRNKRSKVAYVPELCSYLRDYGIEEQQDFHSKLGGLGVSAMSYGEIQRLLS